MSLPAEQEDIRLFEERFWVKSYRPGVPATIDDELAKWSSVVELFAADVDRHRDRTGFASMGTGITYGELYARAQGFAAWLQSRGVEPGDRVAIMMPNCLQYPVALFGTLMAGAVVVNVNPLYTARELKHQLRDSGAVAIVVMEMFGHTLEEVVAETAVRHVVVTALGDMLGTLKGFAVTTAIRHVQKLVPRYRLPGHTGWKTMLKQARRLGFRPAAAKPGDIAFLQYTGGTTGVAKGAMLTHRNIVANILQGRAWIGDQLARQDPDTLTNVTLLPLYHIFSLTANLLTFTGAGGRNILIANPRDSERVQSLLRNENFHGFCGINTLFAGFLDNEKFCKRDFSNLRMVIAGGMATHRSIAERWEKVTGRPIVEGYGLTECSPVVCVGYIDIERPETMRYTGKVGFPAPSTEVRMRRPDGSWCGLNEAGELCVRGPQVMAGYWQRPEDTAKVLGADGWLATGDIGRMDDTGQVEIVDRIKDMILVSGFNVYPNEIEAVIAAHPLVREVAVIGVPDPVNGERVKAVVVPRTTDLTEQEIVAYCRRNLTGYKIPRIVEFRSAELPKAATGKVLRRELK